MRLASAVIQPYRASQEQLALVAHGYAQVVPDSVDAKDLAQRMSRNPLEHVRKLIIECATRCNYSCSHCYNAGEGYGNIHERPLIDILNTMQDSLIYRLHAGRRIGDYLQLVDPGVFGHRFAHLCALRAVTTMIARRMHEEGIDPDDAEGVKRINREVALVTGRTAAYSVQETQLLHNPAGEP